MSAIERASPTEWDADVYHRVSDPQLTWGLRVLDRLPLNGTETVVDAGCGSGRLTGALLERLPHGHVIAVDRSANMLAEAASHLRPRFGDRVSFLQLDIQDITLPRPIDAVFSTAAFHWIPDHPRLFRALFDCLRPRGMLVAQCGGGPNIAALVQRAESLLASPSYRDLAPGWRNPWEFATPETAAQRLAAAGFIEVATGLEHEPTTFPDADSYREFVDSVVLRAHLDAFSTPEARRSFMAELTQLAATDEPPFLLDYWRLNIFARRPLD